MKMKEYLEKIAKEMAIFNESINAGITEQEACNFVASVEHELSVSLPVEYLEILKIVNGLEFNGSILYGADEEILGVVPNQAINGLIDSNKVLYENEWQKQYIFLGESSISWYVYDLQTKRYLELDNPSGDEIQQFGTCEKMVESLLNVALM